MKKHLLTALAAVAALSLAACGGSAEETTAGGVTPRQLQKQRTQRLKQKKAKQLRER